MTTDFIYRIALIVPDPQRAAANRIAEVMGWGPGCYSVPLSADGTEPATHWGLSTAATQRDVNTLAALHRGIPPEGADQSDVDAVAPVLLMAADPADRDPGAQFAALAGTAGLQRMEPAE